MSDTTDTTQEPQRCQGVSTRTGKPCQAKAKEGGYCGNHSLSNRTTKARNARLRGLARPTVSQPNCGSLPEPTPEDVPETYDGIIGEAWRRYRERPGVSAECQWLKLAMQAMAERDSDARDKIRLKVGEMVLDKISFAPTVDSGPVPVPAPWEDRQRAAG
jgi:hypothetical protein